MFNLLPIKEHPKPPQGLLNHGVHRASVFHKFEALVSRTPSFIYLSIYLPTYLSIYALYQKQMYVYVHIYVYLYIYINMSYIKLIYTYNFKRLRYDIDVVK